ncbi:hypothetical protein [Cypionkella sp.]|nr:hypothetical protein [Cypionkella sp.]MDB5665070.1 hypothetical protein [Cypionkella sp.]
MFYCGFDPGLEAYLASQNLDLQPSPTGYVWAASVLLAFTIFSLVLVGTT